MRRRASGFSMSFLDVLCSAMGGAVVLAVVFSIIKHPVLIPKVGEFILVEVTCKGEPDVGLLVVTPNGEEFCLLPDDAPERLMPAAPKQICRQTRESGPDDERRTKLFVEIREPSVGVWELRPYLSDWQADSMDGAVVANVRVWLRSGPQMQNGAAKEYRLHTAGLLTDDTFRVQIEK